MLRFSVFLSWARSCENLHFVPLVQSPRLKYSHTIDLESPPFDALGWVMTTLDTSAMSAECASAAALSAFCRSRSRSRAFARLSLTFEAVFSTCCTYLATLALLFLFFKPNVLSSMTFFLALSLALPPAIC
eukprot:Amastigsp_a841868_340.p4 type:complete len:131 gc:universal Amastigsp_a841868_340:455-63(-)